MIHAEALAPIEMFLNRIGLPVTRSALSEDSFLPGVVIKKGALVVDPERLGSPGDILHEAGHLAVAPGRLRNHLDGNIDACAAALCICVCGCRRRWTQRQGGWEAPRARRGR